MLWLTLKAGSKRFNPRCGGDSVSSFATATTLPWWRSICSSREDTGCHIYDPSGPHGLMAGSDSAAAHFHSSNAKADPPLLAITYKIFVMNSGSRIRFAGAGGDGFELQVKNRLKSLETVLRPLNRGR